MIIKRDQFENICYQVRLMGKTDHTTYMQVVEITGWFFNHRFANLRSNVVTSDAFFEMVEAWKSDLDANESLTLDRTFAELRLQLRICLKRRIIKVIRFIKKYT